MSSTLPAPGIPALSGARVIRAPRRPRIDQAAPCRSSFPGVAPVHTPSAKVTSPFTSV